MIRLEISNKISTITVFRRTIERCLSSNGPINIEKLEKESTSVEILEDDLKLKEERIQASRNKSRLNDSHRNIVFEQNPYPQSVQPFHDTLKYQRKLFGRYGFSSGVNPSICWPTEEELQEKIEYEQIAYPHTIPEMVKAATEVRNAKNEEMKKRQEGMLVKMSKLQGWIKDLEMRMAKKEAEANVNRLKRERLIEEVRKHFGYKVDPKDEKFKELLEKKEKEQKKIAKEARKKEREAKLMEKLRSKKKEDKSTGTEVQNNPDVDTKTDEEKS